MSNSFDGYRLTSPFGMRKHPVSGVNKFHRGVDLVVTPADGNQSMHLWLARCCMPKWVCPDLASEIMVSLWPS